MLTSDADWYTPPVQAWKKEAEAEQQEFYLRLGDRKWDFIAKKDWLILQRKVAFGLFGPPNREPCVNNNYHTDIGYSVEQMMVIDRMCKTIEEQGKQRENKEDIWFACIFICCKMKAKRFLVPVFKTLKLQANGVDQDIFIDTDCRVYDGWADYLKNNKLPKCMYCYPRNGTYTGSGAIVHVDFGTSPATKITSRIISMLDTAATVVTVGATAVGVATVFTIPMAGPVVAFATMGGITSGAYGAGRSIQTLYDMKTHKKNIGILNAEARNCWLAVVGGTLGLAQARMAASMSKAANLGRLTGIASKAVQITFLAIHVGCVTVGGIGIINGFAVLVDKYEKHTLTSLDVLQFSASCLFFTHGLINFGSAKMIIKEIQKSVNDPHNGDLDLKDFTNRLKNFVSGHGEMHGNVKHAKPVRRIRSTKEFFSVLVGSDDPSSGSGIRGPDGSSSSFLEHLGKNSTTTVVHHPPKFYHKVKINRGVKKLIQIDAKTKYTIINKAKELAIGIIIPEEFRYIMDTLWAEVLSKLEHMAKVSITKLCETFGVEKLSDIDIDGRKIFVQLQPEQVDRLVTLVVKIFNNHLPDIIGLVKMIATLRQCDNFDEFCNCLSNVSQYVFEKKVEYEILYWKDPKKFDVDIRRIRLHKKRMDYFEKQVYKDFHGDEETKHKSIIQLNRYFKTSFRGDNGPCGQIGKLKEFNVSTDHFFKFSDLGSNGRLSDEQCFQIASELLGVNCNRRNSRLCQIGDVTFTYYFSPFNGAHGVKIQKFGDGIDSFGIATIIYDVL